MNKTYFKFLLPIILLVGFGIIMISSIGVPKSIDLTKSINDLYPSCNTPGVNCYYLLVKHLIRVMLGAVALVVASKINYKIYRKYAVFGFSLMVIILFAVLIIGKNFDTTATSWIVIFDKSFQPAEIAKLCMIVYFAVWLDQKKGVLQDFQKGFVSFGVLASAIMLPIVLQPDLGSSMVFALIAFCMFYYAGASKKHLLSTLLIAVIGITLILPIHPYIKHRFKAYINPNDENCEVTQNGYRRDYCWQTRQANIAEASGGFFGQGLTKGTQKSYWLPQASDDFVFAASAEEIGFLRSSLIVGLFMYLILTGFYYVKRIKDNYGRLIILGICTWIAGQAFINIGVNIGLLPVTGVTLPFISYGGSSMLATCFGVGIVINVISNNIKSINENSSSRRGNRRSHYS